MAGTSCEVAYESLFLGVEVIQRKRIIDPLDGAQRIRDESFKA
jgi:hypothetical protein